MLSKNLTKRTLLESVSRDEELPPVLTVCLPGLGAAGGECEPVRQWRVSVSGQQPSPSLHIHLPLRRRSVRDAQLTTVSAHFEAQKML